MRVSVDGESRKSHRVKLLKRNFSNRKFRGTQLRRQAPVAILKPRRCADGALQFERYARSVHATIARDRIRNRMCDGGRGYHDDGVISARAGALSKSAHTAVDTDGGRRL